MDKDVFKILQQNFAALRNKLASAGYASISEIDMAEQEAFVRPFIMPRTRVPDSQYAVECQYSPVTRYSENGSVEIEIPSGLFVTLKRTEKPKPDQAWHIRWALHNDTTYPGIR